MRNLQITFVRVCGVIIVLDRVSQWAVAHELQERDIFPRFDVVKSSFSLCIENYFRMICANYA